MGEFPNKATQFKKGNDGGPGRPKERPIAAAIKALLDKDDAQARKALAAVCVQKALKGDFRYARELMERIDGKVPQGVDVTSGGEKLQQLPGLTAAELELLAKNRNGPQD